MSDEQSRITALEELVAHQGKTIEELSDQVAEQWKVVEQTRQKLDRLTERFLTLEAMRSAGFEVLGMVNEPAAAGIEYAQRYRQSDVTKRREHVAVYDLGGGTFDVSVIRMTGTGSQG